MKQPQIGKDFSAAWERLPPREREVLELIAREGLENGEIADRLGIAVSTVETHRSRGIRSLAQYVRVDSIGMRRLAAYWWTYVRG